LRQAQLLPHPGDAAADCAPRSGGARRTTTGVSPSPTAPARFSFRDGTPHRCGSRRELAVLRSARWSVARRTDRGTSCPSGADVVAGSGCTLRRHSRVVKEISSSAAGIASRDPCRRVGSCPRARHRPARAPSPALGNSPGVSHGRSGSEREVYRISYTHAPLLD
jgi:hypothetical protein